jgi:hypothetical protein
MTYRIDRIKDDKQRPLVTEIPSFVEAFEMWQMHHEACEEWDKLVIVNEDEE